MEQGKIVKVISGFYDIKVNGEIFRVKGSGKLRNIGVAPMVGDFVKFEKNGFVHEILDRRNQLERPKVSNVDQAVIVISLEEPKFSHLLLNKFLAVIEFANIEPIIFFTKKDLSEASFINEYKKEGYLAFEIDNSNFNNIKEINNLFRDKLTVFMGQTGAGKSTTINNLTGTELETQEISKALGRGKHTTRVVEIIPWNNGELIDTPGFSSFNVNMKKTELAKAFKNYREVARECKFTKNCLHDKEKVCAVKERVENGKFSKDRYLAYLKLLTEVEDERN